MNYRAEISKLMISVTDGALRTKLADRRKEMKSLECGDEELYNELIRIYNNHTPAQPAQVEEPVTVAATTPDIRLPLHKSYTNKRVDQLTKEEKREFERDFEYFMEHGYEPLKIGKRVVTEIHPKQPKPLTHRIPTMKNF